ncbi:MAG TPA: aspartyl/asparaginyl beta-hydroxylase domain-containing protein [Bryobacteraceae bacterium]|nr:aspartyl/asparaginyl beta-hydroxylase domain-containing protein [Bryobacteraceae bacterium]
MFREIRDSDWIPTIPDGPYKNEGWRVVKIVHDRKPTPFLEGRAELQTVLQWFKAPIVMAVYYSMLPGTELHPHRDTSGTLELGRLRFHVPIQTNPNVRFMVSKKRVPMEEGQLWALNTSYLHAVENKGESERVHLVIEVEANDWCWSMLPARGAVYYAHYAWFMFLLAKRGITALTVDRKSAGAAVKIGKFVIGRLMGRGKAT